MSGSGIATPSRRLSGLPVNSCGEQSSGTSRTIVDLPDTMSLLSATYPLSSFRTDCVLSIHGDLAGTGDGLAPNCHTDLQPPIAGGHVYGPRYSTSRGPAKRPARLAFHCMPTRMLPDWWRSQIGEEKRWSEVPLDQSRERPVRGLRQSQPCATMKA